MAAPTRKRHAPLAPVSDPKTTIVVVTYNARRTIGPLLDALAPAKDRVRVVVADNASADDTLDFVRAEHPWVVTTPTGGNLGFGRGCNAGAAHAGDSPYILFLNPDAVMKPEALDRLEAFMDAHPKAGICAPAIREGDELQAAGLMPSPLGVVEGAVGVGHPHPEARDIRPGEPPFLTNWVCGAALMIRASLFRALGGFDPRFFLYFEETDLCRRASEGGWEIWGVGEAVIEHEGGGIAKDTGDELVAGCIAKYYFESRYYYLEKHHGRVAAAAAEAGEVAGLLAKALAKRALGKKDKRLRQRLANPLFKAPKESA